jgi:hypothetical protein
MNTTLRVRLAIGGVLVAAVLIVAPLGSADEKPMVVVDKDKRTITIDAKIAPRKIDDPRYTQIYPIEVIACWPFPKGQKAHETVVTLDEKVKPSEIHKALVDFGLKPGEVGVGEGEPKGPEVKIFLEIPTPDGEKKKVPIEKTLLDPKTNKPMPPVKWRFTGSTTIKDPDKGEVFGADTSGTLIAIFPVTPHTVFQTNLTLKEEKFVKLETDKKLLPKEGTAVKLIIEVPAAK